MQDFIYQHQVQLDELDAGRHVGHAQWLTYLERARIHYQEYIGYSFNRLLENNQFVVVSELSIRYRLPAFFRDQLSIRSHVKSLFSKGMVIVQTVENQQQRCCVRAEVTVIFVDEHGRSTPIPDELRQKLIAEMNASSST